MSAKRIAAERIWQAGARRRPAAGPAAGAVAAAKPPCLGSPAKAQGVATLLAVMLLIVVAAFGLVLALAQSASNQTDATLQDDSVAALFLAESGLERAIRRLVSGAAACDATLAEGPIALGRGDFTIAAGSNQDFNGAPLPPGRCRVTVSGRVAPSGAARVVQAIVASGSSIGSVSLTNGDFNSGGPCPPSGPTAWTVTADWGTVCDAWTNTVPDNSSRVLVARLLSGSGTRTTTATQAISCTTGSSGSTTFRVNFRYWYDESGGGGGQKWGTIFLLFRDSLGVSYQNSLTVPKDRNWRSQSLDITIPAGLDLTSFEIRLVVQNQPTVELAFDDVSITLLSGPGCVGGGGVLAWR
jgi:hypothetical protein